MLICLNKILTQCQIVGLWSRGFSQRSLIQLGAQVPGEGKRTQAGRRLLPSPQMLVLLPPPPLLLLWPG